MMSTCKKCDNEIQGNYCSHCGHPYKLKRINGRYILSEIGSVLNFQKGIFYTIKELLIRPGQSIRTFIKEDRNRLVKPIMFILISSLIYTVFVSIFHFEDGYIKYSDDLPKSATVAIFQWISQNYGYSNILMALFIAIWIKIFFRKYGYNFFEILILLCFVMGIEMLLFSFLGVLGNITKLKFLNYGASIAFIYAAWAIGQFFHKRKILNYLKAFVSYFLGFITFIFIAMGIGILIDLIR